MFNNAAIDVAIGLVFVYLLYSLLASIVQEAVANWLDLRPRILIKSIAVMLDDVSKQNNDGSGLMASLRRFRNPFSGNSRPVTASFYNQPSIKFLKESDSSKGPSYLTAVTFSETLMRMLKGAPLSLTADSMAAVSTSIENNSLSLDPQTALLLKHFMAESNADLNQFKEKLEGWFNDTQSRATGWYKRQTQIILFVIGLFFAFGNNVDTIKIGKILSTNPLARQQVTQLAVEFQKQKTYERAVAKKDSAQASAEQIKQLQDNFNAVDSTANKAQQILGLGWSEYEFDCPFKRGGWESFCLFFRLFCHGFIGCVITAAMISLGAPFWFDMLNKIMQLRGSKREDSDGGSTSSSPASKTGGPVPASMRKG